MKINLIEREADTLLYAVNWKVFGFSVEEEAEIQSSLPIVGDWNLPDFAVERIRSIVCLFGDKSIYEKMEAQTIRGTLHISLDGVKL